MPGLEGTKLGRYRLQRRLDGGGMSEVYLAFDELMYRDVAIKVVSSSHVDYIDRFQREAEALGNLHHNHILPAFDYGAQEPWHYLVMPYIEHESLSERLERGPFTLEDAGEMLSQIASGLQHAHEHGIVHRDIKPSNILLQDDHHAYLADFGLAKAVDGAGSVTQAGVLLGTPEFMAPELADGPASMSSDLYALGILLYQMVTGQLPFTGDTALAVFLKQMHEQPIPPSRLNPAIPSGVEQIILRALDKDPRRRFQTPNTLAQAYLEALHTTDTFSSRTSNPLVKVVLNDSGEMPPLYNGPSEMEEELAQAHGSRYAIAEPYYSDMRVPLADTSLVASAPVVAQEEKLVLPAYSLDAKAVTPISSGQTLIQRPARPVTPVPGRLTTKRLRSARHDRNVFVVTSFMGISFLLIIMSVILYAVFTYSSSRLVGRTAVATAQVSITTQPTRTDVTQTKATPASKARVTTLITKEQRAVATADAITSGTPALVDDLSSSIISDWYVDPNSCVFARGAYHVIAKQADHLVTCESNILSYDNAALQVDVSLLSGSEAGLIFRANNDQFYDFGITKQGEFFFRRHDATADGSGGTYTYLIHNTASSAIAPGKRKNTLLVIATSGDMKLFINGVFVAEQQDSTYTGGQVGFEVGTLPSVKSGEASFTNFKVFQVS